MKWRFVKDPMREKPSAVLKTAVFDALKGRIIRWEYPPRHRLTEESLSEEFGVSRSPIREALHTLVENGLVYKEPHRGYAVKQPDLNEIHDLYSVRLALELYAVEWLTTHGMPADVWQSLHKLWQAMRHKLKEPVSKFAREDEAFHAALVKCTGNKVLIQHVHAINERIHFIRTMDFTRMERRRSTCDEHLEILDCIRAGTVARARDALRLNIEAGRENVEQAVKEALARAYMSQK